MRARSLSLSLSSLLSALESNGRTFRCFSTATQYQLVHCITTFFSLSLILSFNNLILYGFHVCFHPISSRFRWINTHFLPVVDHILNLCSLFVACCIFAISSIFGPFFSVLILSWILSCLYHGRILFGTLVPLVFYVCAMERTGNYRTKTGNKNGKKWRVNLNVIWIQFFSRSSLCWFRDRGHRNNNNEKMKIMREKLMHKQIHKE